MKERSRYIFGAALMAVVISPLPGLVEKANAAVLTAAQFTFEANGGSLSGTATSVTATAGALFGPFLADSGVGSAYGSHVSTSGYSTPAGNGSTHSFSSTTWAVGDYYQFTVPTSLVSGVLVNFSQTSSATGPGRFKLQYSLDGVSYSDFATYALPVSSSGAIIGFSPAATQTALQFSFDLSGITGLDSNSLASFRVVDNSVLAYGAASFSGTATAGNGTATVAAGGTDRIDDFTVSGNSASVPEPTAVSLLTAAASLALARRRK